MTGLFNKIVFKDFVTLQRGFDLPAQQRIDGEYPIIASTSVTGFHNEWKVDPPGVVTGRSGALGEVQYVTKRFWPLNTALWVKDFKGNHPRFVYYKLKTLDLKRFNSGAGVPTLNRNDLDTLELEVPDLRTQCRIASILSAYDDQIENNMRRIAILEEMARRIYEEWFVRFRFPGHEKVKMVESELGLIPYGWSWGQLRDIAYDVRDSVNPDATDPATPYVGLEHIPRRSTALSEWGAASDVQSMKLRFNSGDILFGKIRPYFHKVAVAPVAGVASSDAIIIRAKEPHWFPLALSTVFSDAFIAEATQSSNGTKMPRANWNVLLGYKVPIPTNEVRGQFNACMNNMIEYIKNTTLRNRNLRATRDLLLPKLISGELDVPNPPEPEAIVA